VAADHPAHGRIVLQPFGVVHLLVSASRPNTD
jgi:hypothetical protein